MSSNNATERTSREPAVKYVSAGRLVADLVDAAYRRVAVGDYWTDAEYRKALAAYNRAVESYRQ